jgi:hypothetical protein
MASGEHWRDIQRDFGLETDNQDPRTRGTHVNKERHDVSEMICGDAENEDKHVGCLTM